MEWEIGEIRQIKDEWYQCLEDTNDCCDCDNYCDLNGNDDCCKIVCASNERIDNKNVYFKKLEKIEEPIVYMNRIFQRVKPIDTEQCKYCYFRNQVCNINLCGNESFLVEIKKDIKEDMKEDTKEYKMHDAKEDIPEFDKVVDECLFGKQELKLKPFDIQKAKEGKPVCTRDGKKARIICFDAKGDKSIIALIDYEIDERPCNYFANGRFYSNLNENNGADLMMLPEKKSGWVNIYKHFVYKTKEEAQSNINPDNELIDTIKIDWEE